MRKAHVSPGISGLSSGQSDSLAVGVVGEHPSVPFAAVNDIDVYFELHGEGPPVLNISGSGNDLRDSPPGVIPLNRAFEVLHYDQRGLGQTSRPDGTYTMADYADDAAALIASMGWTRCHVVGTSFGGMVALNLAARHPDLIDRLVLCCTSPGGEAPLGVPPALRRPLATRRPALRPDAQAAAVPADRRDGRGTDDQLATLGRDPVDPHVDHGGAWLDPIGFQ